VTTLLKDNCGTDVTVLMQDKDIIVRSGSFHTTYRLICCLLFYAMPSEDNFEA